MAFGPKSIRGKVTLAATAVTALAMLLIAGVAAYAMNQMLTATITNSLNDRLDQAQAEVAAGNYQAVLDLAGSDLVQLLDQNGNIVAESPNARGLSAIVIDDDDDDDDDDEERRYDKLAFERDRDDDDDDDRRRPTYDSGAQPGVGAATGGLGAQPVPSTPEAQDALGSGGSTAAVPQPDGAGAQQGGGMPGEAQPSGTQPTTPAGQTALPSRDYDDDDDDDDEYDDGGNDDDDDEDDDDDDDASEKAREEAEEAAERARKAEEERREKAEEKAREEAKKAREDAAQAARDDDDDDDDDDDGDDDDAYEAQRSGAKRGDTKPAEVLRSANDDDNDDEDDEDDEDDDDDDGDVQRARPAYRAAAPVGLVALHIGLPSIAFAQAAIAQASDAPYFTASATAASASSGAAAPSATSTAADSSASSSALDSATATEDRSAYLDASDVFGDNGPYLVKKRTVQSPDGPLTLVAVASLAPAARTAQLTMQVLAVLFLALLCLVVAFVWNLTARTLAPVESMRRTAESITASDLSARIEVPTGDRDLSRLAITFNEMLGRVEASFNEQRRFVSDASHELKSPIAATGLMLEAMRTHPEAVDTDRVVADLTSENDRLSSIVGDLLTLARSDEGRMQVDARPLDMMDLLFEEVASLQSRSTVAVDTSGVEPVVCQADAGLLSHAVRNLLDNAARYAATTVKVSCASFSAVVQVRVSDDGPGIAPENREHVFDRFARLEGSQADSKGTGLGLPVARSIVERHGGTLVFTDSEIGGATALITLPA